MQCFAVCSRQDRTRQDKERRAHCSPEVVTNNNDTSVELFDGLSHTVDHLKKKREQRERET
jgi:hypothetical protein